MTGGRSAALGAAALAAGLVAAGVAFGARSYADRAGDVQGGKGPDIVSVALSNTKTQLTFRVRFAQAPPLRVSTSERWIDMLLIGIDVPPLGPRPRSPGGEWPGVNYAVGMHGPAKSGLLVRLGQGRSTSVGRFEVLTKGSTLTFSVSRRALGSPAWLTFSAAAARELEKGEGGGVDVSPDRGTFRYTFTG